MIPEKAFKELTEGLLEIIGNKIHSIILYGSVARGTAEPDSDVDIAILLNEPLTKEEKDKIGYFCVDMNLEYDTVFSIARIDRTDYQKWLNVMPYYQNIKKEGVLLWEAA